MPTKDGKLTPQERQHIETWFKKHWPNGLPCHCGSDSIYGLADHLFTPLKVGQGGGIQIGGTIYPTFMLICQSCGFSMHVSAIVAGIITPDDLQKKEGENVKEPS